MNLALTLVDTKTITFKNNMYGHTNIRTVALISTDRKYLCMYTICVKLIQKTLCMSTKG